MRKLVASAAALATLASVVAVPELAQARHHYYRSSHRSYYSCRHERRNAANRGTLIGAIGGGLVGNLVAGHHSKTGGTLIGAGVGAVVGHEIARNNHRC